MKQIITKPRVMIFDLFHTLVNFKSDGTSGRNTSDILGIPEDEWNKILWESSEQRLKTNYQDDVAVIRELADQYDPLIPDEKVIVAVQLRVARFRECLLNPPQQRVEVIRALHERGHELILLSNADAMERRAWEESPFAPFFPAALFSCDIGWAKPERESYMHALEVAGVSADQTVFIGDGGSRELQGAKECGMATVMTTEIIEQFWPELIEERKKDADYIIHNLTDLLKLKLNSVDKTVCKKFSEQKYQ